MAYLYLSIFPSLPATFAVFGSGQNSCCSPRRCFYLPSFCPRTRVIKAYHLSHTMKITILYSLCITDIYLMEELHHLGCGRTILKKVSYIRGRCRISSINVSLLNHQSSSPQPFYNLVFVIDTILIQVSVFCACITQLLLHVAPIFVYLYVSFGLPGAPHWGCIFSTQGVAETSPMKKSNHFFEVLKSFQLKH